MEKECRAMRMCRILCFSNLKRLVQCHTLMTTYGGPKVIRGDKDTLCQLGFLVNGKRLIACEGFRGLLGAGSQSASCFSAFGGKNWDGLPFLLDT